MSLQKLLVKERQPMEVEVYSFLEENGIKLLPYHFVTSEEEAIQLSKELEEGERYVLKVMSPKILHKSDFQAVKLNITSNELTYQYNKLHEQFENLDFRGLLVVPMAPQGVELLIGSTTDPTFGVICVFGVGGTMVELVKDVTFAKVPLTRRDAKFMINQLKMQKMLDGPRGLPKTDRQELGELLIKVSEIAHEHKDEIREIDLNPVRVTRSGIYPLDARIIFHPEKC